MTENKVDTVLRERVARAIREAIAKAAGYSPQMAEGLPLTFHDLCYADAALAAVDEYNAEMQKQLNAIFEGTAKPDPHPPIAHRPPARISSERNSNKNRDGAPGCRQSLRQSIYGVRRPRC